MQDCYGCLLSPVTAQGISAYTKKDCSSKCSAWRYKFMRLVLGLLSWLSMETRQQGIQCSDAHEKLHNSPLPNDNLSVLMECCTTTCCLMTTCQAESERMPK